MPQTRRCLYCPRAGDEFVGEILYRRRGGTEIDFDLYLDADTRAYFVVGSESAAAGAGLANSHTRFTVDEFLALHPAARERTAALVRERCAAVRHA